MKDTHLKMMHHGLGPAGVKPIAVALVVSHLPFPMLRPLLVFMSECPFQSNTHVLKLNLTDNWLGIEGGQHLCEMLKENCYIYDLVGVPSYLSVPNSTPPQYLMNIYDFLIQNLSDNQLSAPFAETFSAVLTNNNSLTHITLSGNYSTLYFLMTCQTATCA